MAAQTKFSTINTSGSLKPTFGGIPISQIYCEKENTYSSLENYHNANDASYSINTYAFGSTGTITIPTHHKFIHHAFIRIKVSGIKETTDNNLPGTKGPYTAFNSQIVAPSFFEWISYQAAGMERQIFNPGTLMVMYLDQCEHSLKRQCMCEAFGNYDTLGVYNEPVLGEKEITQYIYMPLPLPSVSFGFHGKEAKPYPLYMLSDAIQVMMKFGKQADIFQNNAWNSTGRTYDGVKFKNFQVEDVRVFVSYGTLGATSEYLNEVYKYPCDIPYSQQYIIPRGTLGVNYKYRQVLVGTRAGETTQLTIRLGSDVPFKRYRGYKLTNIKLYYANYVIWETPDQTSDYYSMLYNENPANIDPSRADVQKISIASSGRVYWYHIPIAAIPIHLKGPHNYAMGADFNNAELLLEFEIHPEDDTNSMLGSDNLKLYVDYFITSVIQFNGQAATLVQ